MNETPTINRLESLLHLYQQGYQSTFIDNTINKLLDTEIHYHEAEAEKLQERLERYEQQYQMTSSEFYRRFQAGELGDDIDLVEWSAFYDMYQVMLDRLNALKAI